MVAAPIRPAERTILVLISDDAPAMEIAELVRGVAPQLKGIAGWGHSHLQRTTPPREPVASPVAVRIRTKRTVLVSKMKLKNKKRLLCATGA